MSESDRPAAGPVQPGEPAQQPAGEPLGAGYRLFGRLGGGAMGEVRRGATSTGEPVAVKLLRPEFADDPSMVARFLQERSILTGLTDENVVHVRDLVAEGTTLAIVMDLVEGPDLRKELISQGTLPPAEAAAIAAGVLRGLAAVHAVGVVHRDVKPENVLLDPTTHPGYVLPRVTDFGISKLVDQKSPVRRTSVIGTPEYMAPELIDDSEPTAASDLYSVGILLYELLTGVTPFGGGSPLAVLRKHVELTAGRPEGIPDPLWAVIADLLAKDPAARPASAALAAARLDAQLAQLAPLPRLPKLTEAPLAQPDSETVLKSLTPTRPTVTDAPADRRRSRRPLLVGALLVVLLGVIGGVVFAVTNAGQAGSSAAPAASTSSPPIPSASPSPSTFASAVASGAPATAPSAAPVAPAAPTVEPLGTMPNVVDMAVADATRELATMGVEVKLTEQLDPSVPDGTVIAQDPPPGDAVYQDAELTVGRRQQTVWLSDLAPVSGDPGSSPVDVDGKNYVHTLVSTICNYTTSTSWEYDLGRSFASLSGTVGLTDDSDSETKVVAEIYRDGTRLFARTVSLGKPAKFKVDVTNGLRLELVMTSTKCGSVDSAVAWVNSRLTGIPALPTPAP